MNTILETIRKRRIHPFPARMAATIPWDTLSTESHRPLRVLDPMAGSGTTIVVARALGHQAIGCDLDPLAVLLSRVWSSDIHPERLRSLASRVRDRAADHVSSRCQYPEHADVKTREFIDYWFDARSRRELTALASAIRRSVRSPMQPFLWCAFSRLIITKQAGASLAMDLSHSRPHKVYERAPLSPLTCFMESIDAVLAAAPFSVLGLQPPQATVTLGDARSLRLASQSIDVVITSPPYLNAIDYVRCHKFSLVWMGYSTSALRELRSTTVGAEVSNRVDVNKSVVDAVLSALPIDALPARQASILRRYVNDMYKVIGQIARVLKPSGRAVFVIGDCSMRGTFVENSKVIALLSEQLGMSVDAWAERDIPNNLRYLPPPSLSSGDALDNRMRREVVLTVKAPRNN